MFMEDHEFTEEIGKLREAEQEKERIIASARQDYEKAVSAANASARKIIERAAGRAKDAEEEILKKGRKEIEAEEKRMVSKAEKDSEKIISAGFPEAAFKEALDFLKGA